MKQIITIQGQTIETYDDSVIQLDYKSNILGEIDKIETCHSYTYAIPTRPKIRRFSGCQMSPTAEKENKSVYSRCRIIFQRN